MKTATALKEAKATEDVEIRCSSGNVFADIGLPDPEEQLRKADLAVLINQAISGRKLTQSQAAKLTGLSQPDISNLRRGRLAGFSVLRLFGVLNALDFDVTVEIKRRPARARRAARTCVHAA